MDHTPSRLCKSRSGRDIRLHSNGPAKSGALRTGKYPSPFALTLPYVPYTLEAFSGVVADPTATLVMLGEPTRDQERNCQTDLGTDRADPTEDQGNRPADV